MTRSRLDLTSLEAREMPAIDLIAGQLSVTGGGWNDAITITGVVGPGADVVTHLQAKRTETKITQFGLASFTETKTYLAGDVTSVQASLGDGNNTFTNQTAKPSFVAGGEGNDTVTGGSGNDIIFAYGGNDVLSGGAGADIISGGFGNDTISGGSGADTLYGDGDNDTVWGNAVGGSGYATDSANTLNGGDGDDALYGSGGNDSLTAGAGDDTLSGGNGHDTLKGDGGEDFLLGSGGDDALWGGTEADTLQGGGGNDTLRGGDGHDELTGDSGDDTLYGGYDDDTLSGGSGNDTLRGDSGTDHLTGNSGNDHLVGGSGFDSLIGGTGVDTLVAVDGGNDLVFGGDSVATSERDEFWVDASEVLANQMSLMHGAAVDPDAVHAISGYRSYTKNGAYVTVGTQADVGDLVDPSAQAEDDNPVQGNFGHMKLFNDGGPKYQDVKQGEVGSCYFLARLAALARTHPQFIRDMVVDLGDGTYAVQLHNADGDKRFVRVDADFYISGGQFVYNGAPNGALWAAVVEKAWAIHRYGTASYDDIAFGNGPTDTDTALGLKNAGVVWKADTANGATFALAMRSHLAAGHMVIMSGPGTLSDTTPEVSDNQTSARHVYMVRSVAVNSSGVATAVSFYDPYGREFTMTDLDKLFFCATRMVALDPK